MVKAGAFDEIDKNRKKLFNSIPKIIQVIKNKHEDKLGNQSSLFDKIQNSENETFEFESDDKWSKNELLAEEFTSLGFYISDHPLNDYKEFFSELKIKPFKEFKNQNEKEGLIAGTIMSIQEKKSLKGKPFAIVKFSDNTSEYELFLFSELLINNREKLKESNSFILTVSKDNVINNNAQPRVNVRKILDLSEMVNTSYKNVSIELEDNYNLSELENSLRERGKTQISIIIPNKDKRYEFKLENNRKFDLSIFKAIKNKEYVKKISF